MLLAEIEAFLACTGMPWTQFGRLAAHDPRLVGDLRAGRKPRAPLRRRITKFMASYESKTGA